MALTGTEVKVTTLLLEKMDEESVLKKDGNGLDALDSVTKWKLKPIKDAIREFLKKRGIYRHKL